jgi:Ca2+-transporting ATPase
MGKQDRPRRTSLFSKRELTMTLMVGVTVAGGLLALYHWFMVNGYSQPYTRTMVFLTIMMSNIWLTFTGRSSTQTLSATFRYTNTLALPVLLFSILFICLVYFLPPARAVFGLTTLLPLHVMLAAAVSMISVGWVEIYKYIKYSHR